MADHHGDPQLSDEQKMTRIDDLVSHIWMVRTFLKHCEEAEDDDELRDVYRQLYDYMMALGGSVASAGAGPYLKMARKKIRKVRDATELFREIQPEISSHTNFQMAVRSLQVAVSGIAAILEQDGA